MFKLCEYQFAVLVRGGVFYQAPLAQRRLGSDTPDRVYAKVGSGYVRLCDGGFTSNPKIKWEVSDAPGVRWPENGFTPPIWKQV